MKLTRNAYKMSSLYDILPNITVSTQKSIQIDYDLSFHEPSASSAALVVPFHMNPEDSLTIGMWVQFSHRDEPGVFFTLYSTPDPVSHSGSQARASVQRLLEGLILEQDQFDVHDTLPNTVPDPASLSLTSDYACPQGQVVVAPDCDLSHRSTAG
ncbi:hypothetical protein M8J77_012407 [Diaphorina citri]|nr:hypothetical protein M8J77_012407 [Diaphorina citri]